MEYQYKVKIKKQNLYMETKYEIINLFPTPLYVTTIPEKFSNIVPFLDSLKIKRRYEHEEKDWGAISENTYIFSNPPLKELSEYILEHINNFGKNQLGYDHKGFKFTQSWISYKYPNQGHVSHNHSNSIISGVFYYGNLQKDTPGISFHHMKQIPNSIEIPLINDPISPYAIDIVTFNPTPGTLLLFHSSLPHSVPPNSSNMVRKSIAFNSVPIEGFGGERSLNQLKFN